MKECDQQAQFSSDSHSEGACIVNTEALFQGDCRSENGYGFRDGRPCILVKLNKIYDWFPVPYEYINDMPYDIPETVKEAFQKNIDIGWPEAVRFKQYNLILPENIDLEPAGVDRMSWKKSCR